MERKTESAFVRLVMPDAPEAEIDEATRRWFAFLLIVERIAARLERERDSRNPVEDV